MPPVRSRRDIRRVHAGKRRVPASSMRAASGRSRQQRYDRGYARGYAEGLRVGQAQYGVPFDGTSIIIPTYNKADLLEQCIASIEDHTPIPMKSSSSTTPRQMAPLPIFTGIPGSFASISMSITAASLERLIRG